MSDTPLYIPVLEERKKFKDYRQEIWGDSFSWYKLRSWDTVRYLVFHHSVTNPSGDSKKDVDYIAELHRRRGWGGIGYHLVITPDGVVWYVGDISLQRANVADKNHLVIGVCLVGDFTQYNPTDDQILSAHDLCKYFINNFPALVNINGWEDVKGHSELQATQCPGPAWKGPVDSMYERIKNRIPYTPQPQPEPEIDWKKKFDDLEELFINEKEKWERQKMLLSQEVKELRVKLAKAEEDCQEKIDNLKEKLANAESSNPEFPTIEDFSEEVIIRRAFKIVVDKINLFKKIWERIKNRSTK